MRWNYDRAHMRTLLTQPPAWIDAPKRVGARRPARVLVLVESSRSGVAALREAAGLGDAGSELTVVSLAPQAVPAPCCRRGPGVEVVNCVVREEAEQELREAREILGDAAERATFRTLVGTRDPPLAAWAAAQSFDLIVLPARRLSFGGHPFARRLRRATTAELRLVS
jgi:hypothetical protein